MDPGAEISGKQVSNEKETPHGGLACSKQASQPGVEPHLEKRASRHSARRLGRDKRRVPPWVSSSRVVVNGELACGGPYEAWHAAVLRMMLRMRIRQVGSEWEW